MTRTGTHRSLSGLKTPLAYAVGEKHVPMHWLADSMLEFVATPQKMPLISGCCSVKMSTSDCLLIPSRFWEQVAVLYCSETKQWLDLMSDIFNGVDLTGAQSKFGFLFHDFFHWWPQNSRGPTVIGAPSMSDLPGAVSATVIYAVCGLKFNHSFGRP